MKKVLHLCMICLLAALLFTGCANGLSVPAFPEPSPSASAPETSESPEASEAAESKPAAEQSRFLSLQLESANLKDNLIEASPKMTLCVYLPPSYYESEKAYPVVYYLHGHGERVGGYGAVNRAAFDKAFEAGADEFIFVEIQGDRSYYVNSPVTGNWDDYIIDEAIPLIDESYRTLADRESRGICGFSMGGFGALNLAIRHTDVFCAFYAMSPGLLKDDGMDEAMKSWRADGSFLKDYARAFAPDPDDEQLGRIPTLDGSEADNAIVDQWLGGFGKIEEKIDTYLAQGTPLKAIGLSYGTKDTYAWIPKGTQYFSDYLTEKGIEHTLFVFEGFHEQPPNSAAEHLIPFFDENLKFQ